MATCYDKATRPCASGCSSGAKALMRFVLALMEFNAGKSGGCFNCRNARGTSSPSVHGNGRAIDVMFPGSGHPQGYALVRALIKIAKANPSLGLQFIIWNHKKYGCATGWVEQAYGGQNKHTDHVHVELSVAGSKTLTYEALMSEWAGTPAPPHPTDPEDEMAEGSVGFGTVEQTGQNYVFRLNPLPHDVRWWVNIAARDDAKGWAGFLKRDGNSAYLHPFDFTAPGQFPAVEWSIGPGDTFDDDIVAFVVYREFGTAPVGVTGYWRRP